MNILATYRTHQSIKDMDISVENHISKHKGKLTPSDIKVLRCLAAHSLQYTGACKLKGQTIADEIGISRSTVTRSIKRLKELHVIEVHNNVKANGIKGANIFAIIFLESCEPANEPIANHRAIHELPTHSKGEGVRNDTVTSLKQSFNSFVVKNVVNNVQHAPNLKDVLKAIYNPQSVEGKRAFEELSKIAFGRLKQYMKSHNVPYTQLESIIIKAMHDLVNKSNVRNEAAMYSSMIKRQVEQLFEQPIKTNTSNYKPVNRGRKENVPDWFNDRNKPSTVVDKTVSNIDFEAERQKILAKLG